MHRFKFKIDLASRRVSILDDLVSVPMLAYHQFEHSGFVLTTQTLHLRPYAQKFVDVKFQKFCKDKQVAFVPLDSMDFASIDNVHCMPCILNTRGIKRCCVLNNTAKNVILKRSTPLGQVMQISQDEMYDLVRNNTTNMPVKLQHHQNCCTVRSCDRDHNDNKHDKFESFLDEKETYGQYNNFVTKKGKKDPYVREPSYVPTDVPTPGNFEENNYNFANQQRSYYNQKTHRKLNYDPSVFNPPPPEKKFMGDMTERQYWEHELEHGGHEPDLKRHMYTAKEMNLKFDNPDLTQADKKLLIELIDKFGDVFCTSDEEIDGCPIYQFEIKLKPGATPFQQRSFNQTPEVKAEITRQVREYLRIGFIRPSISPWQSKFNASAQEGLR
jgi:hypothetical protein